MAKEEVDISQLSLNNTESTNVKFGEGVQGSENYDDIWEECFDENSGNPYWYNSIDQTSSWDDPHASNGVVTAEEKSDYEETKEVDDDPSGVKEALKHFTSPPLVPKRWTDFGNSVLFHGVEDPSPFFRVNVFQAENPYRGE